MSATNQTSNYDLPLFIGTDKPSWLGDFNGAMNAIDTAIKGRADDISSLQTRMTATETVANTASSNASTALTNASNAGTAANTAQTTADTANTAAAAAQSTANTALSNATTAQTTADTANATAQSALALGNSNASDIAKLNFTQFDVYTNTDMSTNIGSISSSSKITVATNNDGSVGKVYGYVELSGVIASSGQVNNINVTIPTTKLRPTSNITITGCSMRSIYTSTGFNNIVVSSYDIATNGTITIKLLANDVTYYTNAYLFGCILFLKDFGDEPVE